MAADPAQTYQMNEADNSPDIQTGAKDAAKSDGYWNAILHKARQAAYEDLERYLVQQGIVQMDEEDPLGNSISF